MMLESDRRGEDLLMHHTPERSAPLRRWVHVVAVRTILCGSPQESSAGTCRYSSNVTSAPQDMPQRR